MKILLSGIEENMKVNLCNMSSGTKRGKKHKDRPGQGPSSGSSAAVIAGGANMPRFWLLPFSNDHLLRLLCWKFEFRIQLCPRPFILFFLAI